MTITPTDPSAGVVAPAGDDSRGGDRSAGPQFHAVIHQALNGASSGSAKGARDDTTDPAQGTEPAGGHPADTPDPTALGLVLPPGLASQLGALVAVTTPAAPGTSGAAAGGAADVVATAPAGPGAPSASGHANVAAGTTQPLTGTTSDIRMSGDAIATAATTTPPTPAPAHEGTPTSPQGAAHPDTADDAAAHAADEAQAPAAPTPAATPTSPAPGAASVLPAGLAAVPPSAGATPAAPVTGQVFPEVTSLVSRGEGTHRIALTLKPEALGEVRVVMTVRDGAVHVRLAAGHEAQQALLEGSPELTRLLEHAGASDTRIVVRDLAALSPSAASADTGRSLGRDPGQGLGSGAGPGTSGHGPQDHHAGTRAEHLATDGAHRSTTTGANPPRSDEPATHTRRAGVDVAM